MAARLLCGLLRLAVCAAADSGVGAIIVYTWSIMRVRWRCQPPSFVLSSDVRFGAGLKTASVLGWIENIRPSWICGGRGLMS
jgi:hypothetical protein